MRVSSKDPTLRRRNSCKHICRRTLNHCIKRKDSALTRQRHPPHSETRILNLLPQNESHLTNLQTHKAHDKHRPGMAQMRSDQKGRTERKALSRVAERRRFTTAAGKVQAEHVCETPHTAVLGLL